MTANLTFNAADRCWELFSPSWICAMVFLTHDAAMDHARRYRILVL